MLKPGAAHAQQLMHSICPKCRGGQSRERSLQTFADGAERCWRAKCGYYSRGSLSRAESLPDRRPMPYLKPLMRLPESLQPKLKLPISVLEKYGVKYAPADNAIYMPVCGPSGQSRGGVLRRLDNRQPKAIAYRTDYDNPWQAWYGGNGQTAVVEDQVSAMRIGGSGHNACAALGTVLTAVKAAEIRAAAKSGTTGRIYLAFDADATARALRYKSKYPWLHVLRLDRDVKDMSEAEFQQFLDKLKCS